MILDAEPDQAKDEDQDQGHAERRYGAATRRRFSPRSRFPDVLSFAPPGSPST